MKKEDDYHNRLRKRGSGLPTDDLEKKLEEFKKKAMEEIEKLKQEEKDRKVQKRNKRRQALKQMFYKKKQ